jgi:hypothetical protein
VVHRILFFKGGPVIELHTALLYALRMPHTRYPRTSAWYKALPDDKLMAYATCLGNTRLPMAIAAAYPQMAQLPELPQEWRAALMQPMAEDSWLPETHLVLQYLLLRDAYFHDDAAFFAATKKRVVSSFLNSHLRPLMKLMSPHLLVMGAGKRWGAYHQGTTLAVRSIQAKSFEGTLTYPDGLYPPLMIDDTRVAIEAAIEMTGKVITSMTAEVTRPGVCTLRGAWA